MPTGNEIRRLENSLTLLLEEAMVNSAEAAKRSFEDAQKAKSDQGKKISEQEINLMIRQQARIEAKAMVKFISDNVLNRIERLENRLNGID